MPPRSPVPTVDCGLWTLDCGLWTVDCGLQPLDIGLWTLDLKGFLLQLSDGPAAQDRDRCLGRRSCSWQEGVLPRKPFLKLLPNLRRRIARGFGWLSGPVSAGLEQSGLVMDVPAQQTRFAGDGKPQPQPIGKAPGPCYTLRPAALAPEALQFLDIVFGAVGLLGLRSKRKRSYDDNGDEQHVLDFRLWHQVQDD